MDYYAQTMPGVEEIAWLEIRNRLQNPTFGDYLFAKEQNGIVTFSTDESLESLLGLRTTEDVFIQAISLPKLSRGYKDLQRLTNLLHKGDGFGRAVNQFMRLRKPHGTFTYRVISRKYGQHEYKRQDVTRAAIKGIELRYPRWQPVADGGLLEVWVNLLGSHLLVGVRLSNRTMRHRFDKAQELPASLRPSVAAAMVYLTEPDPDDVFLDPLCGSGTLLLERAFAGEYDYILGGDVERKHAKAAQKNLRKVLGRSRGSHTAIDVRTWDAQDLPIEDGAIDKVATNLPFGKQISSKQGVKKLYPKVLKELARVVRKDGRLVFLTSEYDQLKTAVRQVPQLETVSGYSVSILGQWARIYIVKRV